MWKILTQMAKYMKVPGDDTLLGEDSYYQVFPNFDNYPFIEQNHELSFNQSLGWVAQPWWWLELYFPRDLEGERYPTPEDSEVEEFDPEEEEEFLDEETREDVWSTDPWLREDTEHEPLLLAEGDELPEWESDNFETDEILEENEEEEEDDDESPVESTDDSSSHNQQWAFSIVFYFNRLLVLLNVKN